MQVLRKIVYWRIISLNNSNFLEQFEKRFSFLVKLIFSKSFVTSKMCSFFLKYNHAVKRPIYFPLFEKSVVFCSETATKSVL